MTTGIGELTNSAPSNRSIQPTQSSGILARIANAVASIFVIIGNFFAEKFGCSSKTIEEDVMPSKKDLPVGPKPTPIFVAPAPSPAKSSRAQVQEEPSPRSATDSEPSSAEDTDLADAIFIFQIESMEDMTAADIKRTYRIRLRELRAGFQNQNPEQLRHQETRLKALRDLLLEAVGPEEEAPRQVPEAILVFRDLMGKPRATTLAELGGFAAVKKAFRDLSRVVHPDKLNGIQDPQKELNEAYATLEAMSKRIRT